MPDKGSVPSPITLAVVISIVVLVGVVGLALAIAGNYILMVHYVHQFQDHIDALARSDARAVIAASQRASLGRSRSLCDALKQLATTHAAHKLHPVFRQVYNNTQCSQITGALPPG